MTHHTQGAAIIYCCWHLVLLLPGIQVRTFPIFTNPTWHRQLMEKRSRWESALIWVTLQCSAAHFLFCNTAGYILLHSQIFVYRDILGCAIYLLTCWLNFICWQTYHWVTTYPYENDIPTVVTTLWWNLIPLRFSFFLASNCFEINWPLSYISYCSAACCW